MIYIVNIAWVLVLVSMCVVFDRLFREVGHRLKKALEREQAARNQQTEEFRRLLLAEYGYWKQSSEEVDADHDQQIIAMGAMGAVSNVLAATLGKPAAWHQKKAEEAA